MDLQTTVSAALAGVRLAMLKLAIHSFGWPRAEVAMLSRGDAAAIARLQEAARKLMAPRSGAVVVPTIVGTHRANTVAQLSRCLDHDDAVAGAICANGHLDYSQPVGGVVAYREHVSVLGVGFDIGCGNLAVRTDMTYGAVKDRVGEVLDAIGARISFGEARTNAVPIEHALFDDVAAWQAAEVTYMLPRARKQFGTVGAGSHYVDLFHEARPDMAAEDSPVWIGIHFGSHRLGDRVTKIYLMLGGGIKGNNVPPTLLHQDTDRGRAYLAAMELAGRYAHAGREWVAATVLDILGARAVDEVHNRHNFAWREEVAGAPAWVVRKGCTPAFPGQRGFVGGSMGDDAVILEGVAGAQATALLNSTVHGAGRVCGREHALRRFKRDDMVAWLQRRGVALRGGYLDESPMAYRRLPDVLAHHADSVRVLHTLRPFAVVMAGAYPYTV
jgi:tRNA-splicing ligase RtcB